MPLLRVLGKGFKSVAKTLCPKTREAATAIGPVINYVRGSSVDVAFLDRQVQTVTVKDSVAGVYVEPVPKVKPKKTDTTAAPKKTPAKKTTP